MKDTLLPYFIRLQNNLEARYPDHRFSFHEKCTMVFTEKKLLCLLKKANGQKGSGMHFPLIRISKHLEPLPSKPFTVFLMKQQPLNMP